MVNGGRGGASSRRRRHAAVAVPAMGFKGGGKLKYVNFATRWQIISTSPVDWTRRGDFGDMGHGGRTVFCSPAHASSEPVLPPQQIIQATERVVIGRSFRDEVSNGNSECSALA